MKSMTFHLVMFLGNSLVKMTLIEEIMERGETKLILLMMDPLRKSWIPRVLRMVLTGTAPDSTLESKVALWAHLRSVSIEIST
jgi:hypothetical protein